jgi:hypothetical protein
MSWQDDVEQFVSEQFADVAPYRAVFERETGLSTDDALYRINRDSMRIREIGLSAEFHEREVLDWLANNDPALVAVRNDKERIRLIVEGRYLAGQPRRLAGEPKYQRGWAWHEWRRKCRELQPQRNAKKQNARDRRAEQLLANPPKWAAIIDTCLSLALGEGWSVAVPTGEKRDVWSQKMRAMLKQNKHTCHSRWSVVAFGHQRVLVRKIEERKAAT